jgi:hypothetical protein
MLHGMTNPSPSGSFLVSRAVPNASCSHARACVANHEGTTNKWTTVSFLDVRWMSLVIWKLANKVLGQAMQSHAMDTEDFSRGPKQEI